MNRSAKIAITLPRDLLSRVERLRRKTGEARSAIIRRALESTLRDGKADARVRRYVEAYRRRPETARDVAAAMAIAKGIWAHYPWE